MSSQQNHCQTVDHISNLPDTIISHILSFMPTKSAVSTSILSNRWKYLWTKTPVLDFTEMPPSPSPSSSDDSDDEIYPQLTLQQKTNFRSFIDMVLLHNDVTFVHRLLLDLPVINYVFYIKAWLSLVARREIREISIKITKSTRSKPIEFPIDFLIKEKLVVLKLSGSFAFNERVGVHLPNLETLDLDAVRLPSDELMKSFFSSCPKLKVLRISNCLLGTSLFIDSCSLKEFEIFVSTHGVRIVINTPNLRCIKIRGLMPSIIGDLSLVVEASLDIYCNKHEAIALVRNVSGTETLRIGGNLGFWLDEKLAIFSNLMHLKIFNERSMYILLECAPDLKFLSCENVGDIVDMAAWHRFLSKPSPKCMCSLEKVEILRFYYNSEEFGLQMIAYFLKFGLVLKELNISTLYKEQPYLLGVKKNNNKEQEDANKIYQRLLMLPRSSAACQIKIGEIR